ncbi:MAG TPA: cysteine--tRNA ligase [Thermoplasmata archaeon]|nr:cysteine--tRNA ligase [Thermoplasmata archaeon]
MRKFTVYDSLTRSARLFVPLHPPRVGLFVCGLTPYADAHIGHGRTFVTFDVVARALRRWGYRVFYVQNVTNLDDKVIARAAEEGVDPLALSERHFAAYHHAMRQLGVRSVNLYPFATDYIPEILTQIQALVDRGFAYASQGSVYYEVAKFPGYGKLSGQRLEEQRPGTRVEVEPGKRAAGDFALWKASKPGEPTWDSPWGPGRPGWHIEDTAITVRLLGARYDLHGGGLELKFPHHEAEIAQAEAATGEAPLVNYWMHAGLLNMKGEKMAKSLGNVVRLDDALERFGGEVLRFYYLNAVYRNALEFEQGKSLEEAGEAYERLLQPYRRIEAALAKAPAGEEGAELPPEIRAEAAQLVEHLDELLADDFNAREAVAALFGWTRRVGPLGEQLSELSAAALEELAAPYRWATEVLGLGESIASERPGTEVGPLVEAALAARRRARARGDYAESDRIREDLASAGIRVEDSEGKTRWEAAPPRPSP